MSGRSELIAFVTDEKNSPMRVLGAVVSYLRVQGTVERALADSIDETVKRFASEVERRTA